MKRCVYTALTAGYETLNEQPCALESGIPFICFTDDPDLVSETWQIRPLAEAAGLDGFRTQRRYKLQPHRFLPDFDCSLYIDNSVLLTAPPEAIFDTVDLSSGMAVPAHSFRDAVLDEFLQVTREGLDSPARIAAQFAQYRALYPDIVQGPLFWNGILLRDHGNPAMIAAMEIWLDHIHRYSRRDQLSAPVAFALAGLRPNVLRIDNYRSWFHSWPHATGRKTALRLWRPEAETQPYHPPVPDHGAAAARVGDLPAAEPLLCPAMEPASPRAAEPVLSDLVYRRPGWKRWVHGLPMMTLPSLKVLFSKPLWRSRTARLLAGRAGEVVTAWFKDVAIAIAPRQPRILDVAQGRANPGGGRSVALYVHFSPTGVVSEMVLRQLEAYGGLGFDIAFVSNAPLPCADSFRAVGERAALVIHRRNVGYDFGAWKDVLPLALERWPGAEEILFVNDSCLGPLRPLQPALDAMRGAGNGMFGMQESLQGGSHLQSWFILVRGKPAIADIATFLRRLRLSTSKWKTIQRGELRMSRRMLKWGHRVCAVHSYASLARVALDDIEQCIDLETMFFHDIKPNWRSLVEALRSRIARRPLNPTHHLWRSLIKSPYCSFIKTELVAKNPGQVPHVTTLWKTLVPAESTCPLDVLESHLAAMGHG